jgi:hypothetical protein
MLSTNTAKNTKEGEREKEMDILSSQFSYLTILDVWRGDDI